MKISINTPSYKRPNAVKTLRNYPSCKVWVDESEAQAYRDANPNATIVACPKGVQGNVARVRNYIIDTELQGGADAVVMVDDDLSYIERFDYRNGYGYVRKKLTEEELYEMVAKYTIMAQDIGAKYWGVNINQDNLSYEHNTPFSTKNFIGGPFGVFLKGNRCRYDEALPLKEDYDMTIQQLNKERVVLRVNAYHYICEQSTNTGGCAAMRNRERERQQFEALQAKWGSAIVRRDKTNRSKVGKEKIYEDYNPIIKVPIKGV